MAGNKRWVFLLVALSAFFWGSNFNAAASVVAQVSPLIAAAERFIIATVVIFIVMLVKGTNSLAALKNNWLAFILLGLCGITGFNLAFFIGLQSTSAINGALIMATSPLTTTLLATFVDKHKISPAQVVGMMISLVGVVLVISHGSLTNLLTLQLSRGDVIIMLGNLAWAIYTVGCRKYVSNATSLQTTSFTMLFGTVGIIFFAAFYGQSVRMLFNLSLTNHMLLVYMGIAGSVLAYLFWNIGIKELGAANTAVFFNLVPVFTMVLALLTGTVPDLLQFAGSILVIGGVLYTTGAYKMFTLSRRQVTAA